MVRGRRGSPGGTAPGCRVQGASRDDGRRRRNHGGRRRTAAPPPAGLQRRRLPRAAVSAARRPLVARRRGRADRPGLVDPPAANDLTAPSARHRGARRDRHGTRRNRCRGAPGHAIVYLAYQLGEPRLAWQAGPMVIWAAAAVFVPGSAWTLRRAARDRRSAIGRHAGLGLAAAALGAAYFARVNYVSAEPTLVRAIVCLDRVTGAVRWTLGGLESARLPIDGRNTPATPTPATDGRIVCGYFGTAGLLCGHADGRLAWSRTGLGPETSAWGRVLASPRRRCRGRRQRYVAGHRAGSRARRRHRRHAVGAAVPDRADDDRQQPDADRPGGERRASPDHVGAELRHRRRAAVRRAGLAVSDPFGRRSRVPARWPPRIVCFSPISRARARSTSTAWQRDASLCAGPARRGPTASRRCSRTACSSRSPTPASRPRFEPTPERWSGAAACRGSTSVAGRVIGRRVLHQQRRPDDRRRGRAVVPRIGANDLGEETMASMAAAGGDLYIRSAAHLYAVDGRVVPPSE